jgi:ferredoxin--NADP+ reductase
VDETFGLPIRWNEFVKNPEPRFPVEGKSYEAFDPDLNRPVDRVFVAGWSREASSGLVGVARKDGENGAQAVLQFLQTQPPMKNFDRILEEIRERIMRLDKRIVTKEDWKRLEMVEQAEAERLGLEEFKFASNEEMLAAIERTAPIPEKAIR